jgi:threonine dehydrogenase-like Zn-dependent dehydrogenase
MAVPTTQTALIQEVYGQPLSSKQIAVPSPTPGSALIQVLLAPVLSYAREVYNGTRAYPYATPLVPGSSCIGRVAALGPDATSLHVGQLVYVDPTVHSRDDPDDMVLRGLAAGGTPGSKKLMDNVWRDGTYAAYALAPLEGVFALDEGCLRGLGYAEEDLATIDRYLCVGGLRDIGLQAGETIVVAPATGAFGGAAVACCVAMGASVVAMGRNVDVLAGLESSFPRVKTVRITESVEDDVAALRAAAGGRPIDAVFEISPPQAAKSTHIKSCILALRRGGRMSLMGGIQEDYAIPLRQVMRKNLTLKGTWMYNREQVLIKMVETGILKLGKQGGVKNVSVFGLAEWEKAFDYASDNSGASTMVLLRP